MTGGTICVALWLQLRSTDAARLIGGSARECEIAGNCRLDTWNWWLFCSDWWLFAIAWFVSVVRHVGSIQNGWSLDEQDGIISDLKDGQVWLEGVLDKNGRGRIYQTLPVERVLAIEVDLTIHDVRELDAGLFLAKEQVGRTGEIRTTSKVSLRRNKQGDVQVTFYRKGSQEEEVIDLPDHTWGLGETHRVRIESNGEASKTRVSVFLDGLPVLQDLEDQGFGRSQNGVRFGMFVEGNQGRTATLSLDNVNVVRVK